MCCTCSEGDILGIRVSGTDQKAREKACLSDRASSLTVCGQCSVWGRGKFLSSMDQPGGNERLLLQRDENRHPSQGVSRMCTPARGEGAPGLDRAPSEKESPAAAGPPRRSAAQRQAQNQGWSGKRSCIHPGGRLHARAAAEQCSRKVKNRQSTNPSCVP